MADNKFRTVRLNPFSSNSLNRLSASTGEVFYDSSNGSLRVYTSSSSSSLLATRSWVTANSYSLPTATTSVLGGVKVDGTSITISNGIISATPYSLPTASNLVLGGVKVDGTSITITSGVITASTLPTSTNLQVNSLGVGTAASSTAGTITVSNMIVNSVMEVTTISATAATGTINFYPNQQSVLYYTTNASGNWTLNVGWSGSTFNTAVATGQTITIVFMVTQGSPAFYQTGFQIDGSSVTPKWQGGITPNSGNLNSIDVYTYTIIKTGSAAYTVLASLTQFA